MYSTAPSDQNADVVMGRSGPILALMHYLREKFDLDYLFLKV